VDLGSGGVLYTQRRTRFFQNNTAPLFLFPLPFFQCAPVELYPPLTKKNNACTVFCYSPFLWVVGRSQVPPFAQVLNNDRGCSPPRELTGLPFTGSFPKPVSPKSTRLRLYFIIISGLGTGPQLCRTSDVFPFNTLPLPKAAPISSFVAKGPPVFSLFFPSPSGRFALLYRFTPFPLAVCLLPCLTRPGVFPGLF